MWGLASPLPHCRSPTAEQCQSLGSRPSQLRPPQACAPHLHAPKMSLAAFARLPLQASIAVCWLGFAGWLWYAPTDSQQAAAAIDSLAFSSLSGQDVLALILTCGSLLLATMLALGLRRWLPARPPAKAPADSGLGAKVRASRPTPLHVHDRPHCTAARPSASRPACAPAGRSPSSAACRPALPGHRQCAQQLTPLPPPLPTPARRSSLAPWPCSCRPATFWPTGVAA